MFRSFQRGQFARDFEISEDKLYRWDSGAEGVDSDHGTLTVILQGTVGLVLYCVESTQCSETRHSGVHNGRWRILGCSRVACMEGSDLFTLMAEEICRLCQRVQ